MLWCRFEKVKCILHSGHLGVTSRPDLFMELSLTYCSYIKYIKIMYDLVICRTTTVTSRVKGSKRKVP